MIDVNTATLEKMTKTELINEICRLNGCQTTRYRVGDKLFALVCDEVEHDFDGLTKKVNADVVIDVTVEAIHFYNVSSKKRSYKYLCKSSGGTLIMLAENKLFSRKTEACEVRDRENKRVFASHEYDVHYSYANIMSWQRQLVYPTNIKREKIITIYVNVAKVELKNLQTSITNGMSEIACISTLEEKPYPASGRDTQYERQLFNIRQTMLDVIGYIKEYNRLKKEFNLAEFEHYEVPQEFKTYADLINKKLHINL